jgi:hypothetical protein
MSYTELEKELRFLQFLKSTMAKEGIRYINDEFTRTYGAIMRREDKLEKMLKEEDE